jgi:hypothetical protein
MQTITMNVLKLANPELHPVFLKKLKADRQRLALNAAARKRQRIYKRNWMWRRRPTQ